MKEIGVVLGLKTERLTHQSSVDGLIEKLEGYIKKELDYYEDVICILGDGEDPVPVLVKEKDNLFTPEEKRQSKTET